MEKTNQASVRKEAPISKQAMSAGFILLVLGLAQIINAYDTTAMNVAVSRIVQDLHTTVTGVQAALTTYSLVMAAFMIIGSKLGDIWGWKRTFTLGIILYGIGALTTALSPDLGLMITGWSLLEGIGSALMIPAIFSMIAIFFPESKARVRGYAMIGMAAAAGAALGPLICGFLTTFVSWRASFAMEVLVVLIVVFLSRKLVVPKEEGARPRLDLLGAVLSALGLAFVVMGILQASVYGWLTARKAFLIGNTQLIPQGGISPVIVFVLIGLVILALFVLWQRQRVRAKKQPLIDLAIFKLRAASIGLPVIIVQMFMQAGLLFVVPLFLQIGLGFNAFQAGLTLLPLTIALILVATQVSKVMARFTPKLAVSAGLLFTSIGILVVGLTMSSSSTSISVMPGLIIVGIGLGLTTAPLLNLVQSSVPISEQGDISGLNRAFSNLGGALGTAVAGAVLIAALISGLSFGINQSAVLPAADKPTLEQAAEKDAQTVSDAELTAYLKTKDEPQPIENEMVRINAQARDKSLRDAVAAIGVLGLLGFLLSFFLPGRMLPDRKPRGST
ncbi:MAG: MFS transporter [Coprothermobacterota bacterium]|nr:MFS transporter [Coprothermobacterota bacterium]